MPCLSAATPSLSRCPPSVWSIASTLFKLLLAIPATSCPTMGPVVVVVKIGGAVVFPTKFFLSSHRINKKQAKHGSVLPVLRGSTGAEHLATT